VSTFPDEIDNCPAILAPLEMVKAEIGQFTSAKTATEQDRNDRAVALSFEGCGIRGEPEIPCFFRRQPISQPKAQFLDAFYAPDAGRELGAEQSGIHSFVRQPSNGSQPHIDGAWRKIARFEVNSVPQDDGSIEREPRFRAIPLDEFIDRMAVTALRFW
jgi:hypothetical protein